jgi:hypothetical protein
MSADSSCPRRAGDGERLRQFLVLSCEDVLIVVLTFDWNTMGCLTDWDERFCTRV